MNTPNIAAKTPAVVTLDAGTYYWCCCGLSKKQPFCDGAHKQTSYLPLKMELSEQKKVALCQCKQTGDAPYCDGSHSKL